MLATAKNCPPSRRFASTTVREGQRALNPSSASRRSFLKGSASAVLVSGLGSGLLSACGGGLDGTDLPDTPRLASVSNFRDLAGVGAGYLTVDAKRVRRGVFYRANALTLSTADEATLGQLGIASVYDLRTPGEIERSADVLAGGASVQTLNVLGTSDFVTPALDTAAAAVAFMESQARAYVNGGAQRAAYGELLTDLANSTGVQLFHSNAGKDRAGWVAALLLSIANVPLDVIMQDYLLSNTYLIQSINAQIETLRAQDGDAVVTIETPLLEVQESYLQAGFDQVQASYGTMERYLTRGLGMSQTTIDTLRSRLVS
ncbi:Protein tyrosine/serine phosphatase [Paraburkholderia ribeironis]|uniref:Protein tyrosine/serine phosphatase n=1 Tax=Paraburkholderia ribeironis TaxID=1247936 RepID=A0A1N7RPR7_9BURK|nr:tyrosine-protein phosphatase [Paraburkholderia ribeironis]SIT36701.1 Protein tyrosine/serine phosphatase [Paraburkholderia ribeironis]